MKNYIVFGFLLLVFVTCRKDDDDFAIGMSQVKFECNAFDSIFFQATIGQDFFCMSTKDAGATAYGAPALYLFDLGTRIDTLSKSVLIVFQSANSYDSFKPIIKIESPRRFQNLSLSDVEMFDEFIREGSGKIRSVGDSDSLSYNLTMEVFGKKTLGVNETPLYISDSKTGTQKSTSEIVFEEVLRTEDNVNVKYQVKGHFDCKLYQTSGTQSTIGDFYKELKNAKFEFFVLVGK